MKKSDEDDDSKEELNKNRKPEEKDSMLLKLSGGGTPSSSVRKLCESRKLPFQRDATSSSQACGSSKLNTVENGKSTPIPSPARSFNFNAIKSKFAGESNTTDAVKTNKRIRNELTALNEQSPKCSSWSSKPNERLDSPAKKTTNDVNEIHLTQSESKRQKADSVDEIKNSLNMSNQDMKDEPLNQNKNIPSPSNVVSNKNESKLSPLPSGASEAISSNVVKKNEPIIVDNLTDDEDDDIDLSDIGLHKTFIENRDKEKNKTAQETNTDTNDSTKTSNPTTKPPRLTPVNATSPDYWENIYATDYYRNRSLQFGDIMNREFGYAGRFGHGHRNNFFHASSIREPKMIYNQQLQSSREFMNKAINSLNAVRHMQLKQSLTYHDGCVNSLNFNRSGSLLISGSDDYRVGIWDWARSSIIVSFDSGHKSNVFQTKFVPFSGDTQIVTCARDGQVRLALISSTGSHIGTKKLAKHADSCHKVVLIIIILREILLFRFNLIEKNLPWKIIKF